jgi:uncharacterized protein
MSYSLDVNLLLYASDSSSPHAPAARKFLERCASGGDLLYLAWPTLMGYLRISTHPGIFVQPLSPEEALHNIGLLLGRPHVHVLSESERFLEVYREVTEGLVVRGGMVPDAHLAALLRQHGVRTLYTRDKDFRRFPFLDVRDPFAAESA